MRDEPGPLADEKRSDQSPPGRPEPQAAEVESARRLAKPTREALRADGLDDVEIDRLADRFVAQDLGEDAGAFKAWARDQSR